MSAIYRIELTIVSDDDEGELAWQFERFVHGSCWEGDVRVDYVDSVGDGE